MRIFYDTEFVEDGHTIGLISIGLVAEDGRELYRIVQDSEVINRAVRHDWLRANVIPHLPIIIDRQYYGGSWWGWDEDSALYKEFVRSRQCIAEEVAAFILDTPDRQLWAWYAAYDHVALAQLFGRMIDLPDGVPMFTCDLKQEAVRLGNPPVPQQKAGEHDALADARHNLAIATYLDHIAATRKATR